MTLRASRFRPYDLSAFLTTIGFVLIFFFSLRPATDPDYGWHIANGRHVFDGVTLSGKDPYSWTAENLWVAHEWITEAVMSFVHDAFGFTGNSILAALAITATYGVTFAAIRRRGISKPLATLTVLVCFVGALRSVAVRPHVIEMLFFAIAILVTENAIRNRNSGLRFIVVVGLLAVLWVNMHGSFPLLAVLLAITSVELRVSKDRAWRAIAVASAVSAIAYVLNPWLLHIYSFATQSITSQSTLNSIEEWKPPVLGEWLALPILLQLALSIAGLASVFLQHRASDTSPRRETLPSMVGMLRVPAFAFLALQSGRHVMLFGLAAAFFIARGLDTIRLKRKIGARASGKPSIARGQEIVNLFAAAAVSISVLIAGWRVVSPEAQAVGIAKQYPVQLVSYLPGKSTGDRLLNDYNWGGFLILNSNVPVFIDGRSELYGDAQLNRYASIIHLESRWNQTLAKLGVSHVLMPRASRLDSALKEAGWITVAQDSVGSLLQRPR